MSATPDHEVAIVGAGFSGIGAAIKIDRAGFHDLVILEAGDGVGGAWYWNTYPGVAVDIPSFSYQFSFETRDDWSRVYAPGKELRRYANDLVDKYGLRDRIRFRSKAVSAEWDEDGHFWRLGIENGDSITARYIVGATGVFTHPSPPEIPGLDDFAGTTMHSARWDHGVDLKGKRVGVIGTGASAVQVVPSIAPQVGKLVVFQRTPIWCLPKADGPISGRFRAALKLKPARLSVRGLSQAFVELTFPLAAHFDGVLHLSKIGMRTGLKHLEDSVDDPVVREKLTPKYALGCKRPGFSNDYLRTFNRDNVYLETLPIESVSSSGIQVQGGGEHGLDAIIFATGFKVFEPGNMPAYPVRGAGGVDLEQWWDENRFQAYEGVSVPGFPNMFAILGPYGFNGASYFQLIETQSRHIVRCLKRARATGKSRVEITREANDRYFHKMLGRRHNQIFFQDGCATANSYYFDKHGDVPFRASTTLETIWRSARFDLDDYSYA